MPANLQGRRIAFLATDGVEQVELTEPWNAAETGFNIYLHHKQPFKRPVVIGTELVSLETGHIQGMKHDDKGDAFAVDHALDEVDAADYDGLVLPGGVANPDRLRTDDRAVAFVQAFFSENKPMGVICHGPWMLVEADIVRGRTLTSWPSLQTDIRNAGGEWVDQEVVVDRGLVTSRNPGDLPAFCAKLVEELAEGPNPR